jgi:hypothetical protein
MPVNIGCNLAWLTWLDLASNHNISEGERKVLTNYRRTTNYGCCVEYAMTARFHY